MRLAASSDSRTREKSDFGAARFGSKVSLIEPTTEGVHGMHLYTLSQERLVADEGAETGGGGGGRRGGERRWFCRFRPNRKHARRRCSCARPIGAARVEEDHPLVPRVI